MCSFATVALAEIQAEKAATAAAAAAVDSSACDAEAGDDVTEVAAGSDDGIGRLLAPIYHCTV
jgi:hypothetical protein